MVPQIRVECIRKDDRLNPFERITHIGGTNPNGSRWEISQQQAIAEIEKGNWAFYVQQQNRRVNVIVAKSRYGNKYLKTEADGQEPNNLLSLVQCPVNYGG